MDQGTLSPKSDDFVGSEESNFLQEGVLPLEEDTVNSYEGIYSNRMRGGGGYSPCHPVVLPPPPTSSYHYYYSNSNPGNEGEYPNLVSKRTFQPWGGKRARLTDYFHRLSSYKRDTSLGNTRSLKSDVPTARRSTFNPWGG